MSHLLELLGRGLDGEVGDMLDRYFWSPQTVAIEQLRRQCDKHPDWPDVQFQIGVAQFRAVQLDAAIGHLRQAVRSKPDYCAARLALAARVSSSMRWRWLAILA